MNHIVKRKGHKENFDSKKLYASIYAACSVFRMHDQEAEMLSDQVTKEVEKAIKQTHEITAEALHKEVAATLRRYNPDIAYMYDTHKDLS